MGRAQHCLRAFVRRVVVSRREISSDSTGRQAFRSQGRVATERRRRMRCPRGSRTSNVQHRDNEKVQVAVPTRSANMRPTCYLGIETTCRRRDAVVVEMLGAGLQGWLAIDGHAAARRHPRSTVDAGGCGGGCRTRCACCPRRRPRCRRGEPHPTRSGAGGSLGVSALRLYGSVEYLPAPSRGVPARSVQDVALGPDRPACILVERAGDCAPVEGAGPLARSGAEAMSLPVPPPRCYLLVEAVVVARRRSTVDTPRHESTAVDPGGRATRRHPTAMADAPPAATPHPAAPRDSR